MEQTDYLRALNGPGLTAIFNERWSQVVEHGYTLEHDLGRHPGEIGLAALSYLATAVDQLHGKTHPPAENPDTWPWQREAWKPGAARENIVKALAIGWALLDRLDAGAGQTPASPNLADLPNPCTVAEAMLWNPALGSSTREAASALLAVGFRRQTRRRTDHGMEWVYSHPKSAEPTPPKEEDADPEPAAMRFSGPGGVPRAECISCADRKTFAERTLRLIERCAPKEAEAMDFLFELVRDAGREYALDRLQGDEVPF